MHRWTTSGEHGIGKRWQMRYRDLSGKQCKENFAKKTAADSRAAKVTAELDDGTFVNRELGAPTPSRTAVIRGCLLSLMSGVDVGMPFDACGRSYRSFGCAPRAGSHPHIQH
ncbi:hypothetical protein GCM10017776_05950 [Streptomyces griseoluteus]|nr:hypothetical protein GCM10017776_05950 [Streptomyces griseoluteus]